MPGEIRITSARRDDDELRIVSKDSLAGLTRKLAMLDPSIVEGLPAAIEAAFADGALEVVIEPSGEVSYTSPETAQPGDYGPGMADQPEPEHVTRWRHRLTHARSVISHVLGYDDEEKTADGAPVRAFVPPF